MNKFDQLVSALYSNHYFALYTLSAEYGVDYDPYSVNGDFETMKYQSDLIYRIATILLADNADLTPLKRLSQKYSHTDMCKRLLTVINGRSGL